MMNLADATVEPPFQHRPWIGESYGSQPVGSRYLIVGFSHWGRYSDDETDSADFTNHVFRKWVLDGQIRFFNAIAGYFQASDLRYFWSSVAFANTLPTKVGDEDARYSWGTDEQRMAVEGRVKQLLTELTPDKAFVFSKKAWSYWPNFDGTIRDRTLVIDGADTVDYGSYAHPAGETLAFGLRHPQFAPTGRMTIAVQAILRHQIS